MRKRYKLLVKNGKVHILHWESDGKLFGPEYDCIASFDHKTANVDRCKSIVRLMNECERHTNHQDNE